MNELTKKLANSNKRKRRWIYIALVLGCFLIIALLHFYTFDLPFWDRIAREAIWAIFSAVFVLAFVDSVKEDAEDEARKEEIKEVVMNAITIDNDLMKDKIKEALGNAMTLKSGFVEKLDNKYIDQLLERCISRYADKMSTSYLNYIKNSSNVYRSDFKYKVCLESIDDDTIIITHDVTYRKHFRVATDNPKHQYELKCFFATKNRGLDEVMSDDSIFFREELLYAPLVDKITAILSDSSKGDNDKKRDIVREIDLKFTLYTEKESKEEVSIDDISMEVRDSGLLFSHHINDLYISKTKASIGDIFISYYATISCTYSTKRENQFYCIFPNPTIGCKFEMHFDKNIINDIDKDVNYVTMLSLDDDSSPIHCKPRSRNIEFETHKTIFPRSGILVHWKSYK